MPDVKLCECGCGKPTPIAKSTNNRTGAIRGMPQRFLRGHNVRTNDNLRKAQAQERARRQARTEPRRQAVAHMYAEGFSSAYIAKKLGVNPATVDNDVVVLRKRGIDLPYRNVAVGSYVTDELARAVQSEWAKGVPLAVIGENQGWDFVKASTVVLALRRAGMDLPARADQAVEIEAAEVRDLRRAIRKDGSGADLPPDRQTILRLVRAAKRPLYFAEVAEFLRRLGREQGRAALSQRLAVMREKGLLASVRVERTAWIHPRNAWFVPLDAEQPREALTLADAERETELAALIDSQKDELQRGDWIDSEKGRWTKSIDAPLTADGFTILDTLGGDDEALAEFMEDAA